MNRQVFRANAARARFALREMAVALKDRRRWLMLGAVVLVLAVAGPFYTLEKLGFAGRVAYWGAVGFLSWMMIWALVELGLALAPASWSAGLISALAGLAGVLPTMGLVALANLVSGMGTPASGFWGLAAYVAPPVIGICVLSVLLIGTERTPPEPVEDAAQNRLITRLPARLGHDIVALRAQDHYTEVITPLGSTLVLMRMSDAIRELSALQGLQVHRSWWVNLHHVERPEKNEAGRMVLVLDTGTHVPVPRSREAQVRRALEGALAQ